MPEKPAYMKEILKSRTGIVGLDDITGGGFPKEGATLLCGKAGCGKTIMAMLFLVEGAVHGEPGIFVGLEESPEEMIRNFGSIGYDLADLMSRNLLAVIQIDMETVQKKEGTHDMGAFFIRIADAITAIGAKRIAIDTLDTLFAGVDDIKTLRFQLRGFIRWLKKREITTVGTAEAGTDSLTRRGIEEYIADCVIKLDYRVEKQIATRRLRVVKYKGSGHPSDEFPFIIDNNGLTVIPITTSRLEYEALYERISTGIPALDEMLEGRGYFRGSAVLLSGTPGSGKTTIALSLIDEACRRGERCVYFGYEESPSQTIRNMRSIGLDLQQWIDRGLLQIHSSRTTSYGLEVHLVNIYNVMRDFRPTVITLDPMTSLTDVGTVAETKSMLTRLIDFLKMQRITVVFTDLIHQLEMQVTSREEISSLIDTWIVLRDSEVGGTRKRSLLILKSRGMPHSDQIMELAFSSNGIQLRPMRG